MAFKQSSIDIPTEKTNPITGHNFWICQTKRTICGTHFLTRKSIMNYHSSSKTKWQSLPSWKKILLKPQLVKIDPKKDKTRWLSLRKKLQDYIFFGKDFKMTRTMIQHCKVSFQFFHNVPPKLFKDSFFPSCGVSRPHKNLLKIV